MHLAIKKQAKKAKKKASTSGTGAVAPVNLKWKKQKLSRRDLQLPSPATNPTGCLSLTKSWFKVGGNYIDPTTYFRNNVFGHCAWATGGTKEVAVATFHIYVKGSFVGHYNLQISHNPAWESGQHNYTTSISWGNATVNINDPNLIGRPLKLYSTHNKGVFVLELD